MARRPLAIGALVVAGLVLALVLGPVPLLLAQGGGAMDFSDIAALRFTLAQASLSALLSVVFAVPIARALARRQFVGRNLLITLMGAPFLLPVLVVVMSVMAIFGPGGWFAQAGLPTPDIFGIQGVILAHLFLNLPLAIRIILQGWRAIPAERTRLALSLGFNAGAHWRHLEIPMLRSVLPGAVLTIFLVCLTSFTIALTLGGGPRATTIELAIYQAVRFEFDLSGAAMLALLQMGLCAIAILLARFGTVDWVFGAGLDRHLSLHPPRGWRLVADGAVIAGASLFIALPIVTAVFRGLPGLADMPAQVWPALLRSVLSAATAALLAVAGGLMLALPVSRGCRGFDMVAVLPMTASSLVLGTGLFVVIYPFVSPSSVALPLTILVNATLALPFAYRLLLPDVQAIEVGYGRLAGSLGVSGWSWVKLIVLPRLRRPLGFALGVTAALSMGDLGAIALFAGEGSATLPLIIQRLMGAYRIDAAAGASLILMMASFALFWICDHGGRRNADV